MGNSRHIFIQIDCDRLFSKVGGSIPTNDQVRDNTAIYDQGSMALGNAVDTFTIFVTGNQDIHFTILPLVLFTYHKLYFTEFKVVQSNGEISVPNDVDVDGHQVSFKVSVASATAGGTLSFNLYAMLEYQLASGVTQIPICIDPVLRANQGNGPKL